MSEGQGGKQKGVFAGVLAALGIGGLRLADNCASVGARGLSHVDDVARVGGRAGRGLDDAALQGARLEGRAIDDAARLGVEGPAPTRLVIHPSAAPGEEGHWLGELGEFASDVGLELVSLDYEDEDDEDDDAPTPANALTQVDRPLAFDLDENAWAWRRFTEPDDHTDLSELARQGPWVFSGRASGDGLIIEGEVVPVNELVSTCRGLGMTCVFVGCASNCAGATERVFVSSRPRAGDPIDGYAAEFVAARIAEEPRPVFVAIAHAGPGARVTLLRAKG